MLLLLLAEGDGQLLELAGQRPLHVPLHLCMAINRVSARNGGGCQLGTTRLVTEGCTMF